MIESMRIRGFLVLSLVVFSCLYLLPNVVTLPASYPFYSKKLNYGLDIEGGAHLVYGVDVAGVLAERTERMARGLKEEMGEKSVEIVSRSNDAKDSILITVKSDEDKKAVLKQIAEVYGTTLEIVSDSGMEIQARYYDVVMDSYRKQVIDQSIEVIRNRVDEFGVAEPVIAAQGSDRILVQLPGIKDPARAKELINKTAKLEFRLVDNSVEPAKVAEMVATAEKEGNFGLGKDGLTYSQYVAKVNEKLKPILPEFTMIAFEKAPQAKTMEAGSLPMLLRTDSDVSGDQLEDAFVSSGEFGEPKVSFRFGPEGKRKFAALTEKNVGRNLAIVLDEVIYSAPNIRERINGEGQISLGGRNAEESQKEGSLIATALRAGALPATLQQVEERVVGPSLGSDSIQKGKKAGAIGLVLIVLFVVYYYKMTGVIASLCLGLNLLTLLAILSALGATLTLPGIAGISLTMGMAIDANVIIFERIKEELARGSALRAAIRDGFGHAWAAIFDSNITNAIAAAVLIYFGSGPVRGFGVTLVVGILTTMLTAVFVSHFLLDLVTNTFKKKISI